LDEAKHNAENIRGLNMEAVKATSVQLTDLQPQQKPTEVKQELLYKVRNDSDQVYAAYCTQLNVLTCIQTDRR
jgi:hypothetical protein